MRFFARKTIKKPPKSREPRLIKVQFGDAIWRLLCYSTSGASFPFKKLARTLPVKGLGVVTSGQNGPAGSLMTAIQVFIVVLSMKHYLYEKDWTGLCRV